MHRKSALLLLTGYQTPEALRRIGATQLQAWLRAHHAYNAAIVSRALEAAHARHTVVTGEVWLRSWLPRMAQQVLDIDAELADSTP